MEPKLDSVIIIADTTNKGPGPIIPNGDVIDINSKSDGDRDHGQDHHGYVGTITAAAPAPAPAPAGNNYKKKRRGAIQILQVAAFMLRRRRSSDKFKSKSIPASFEAEAVASSKSTWKRLVGSIRPLHLQSGSSNPSTPSASSTRSTHERSSSIERYEDVLLPPMSPARTDDLSSEDGMTSRYASAVSLQELDRTEDHDTNAIAACPGAATHDQNIDAKAEEFIAQFYQQMRLQRLDSIDRRYNDMKNRSIG
ncbi:uncharacterized protein [Pyrus communis]|uniref:uncharacterized protein n=1 Tax=Pyrus communis TaxID=23211 RepID=UPI0035C01BC5